PSFGGRFTGCASRPGPFKSRQAGRRARKVRNPTTSQRRPGWPVGPKPFEAFRCLTSGEFSFDTELCSGYNPRLLRLAPLVALAHRFRALAVDYEEDWIRAT